MVWDSVLKLQHSRKHLQDVHINWHHRFNVRTIFHKTLIYARDLDNDI